MFFSTYSKPVNYDFQVTLAEILGDMRYRKLNINSKNLFPLIAPTTGGASLHKT